MPTKAQARLLCRAVQEATAHRRSNGTQWVMVRTVGERLGWKEGETEIVAAHAVASGWLLSAGTPPHSVALCDEGMELLRGDSRRRVSR